MIWFAYGFSEMIHSQSISSKKVGLMRKVDPLLEYCSVCRCWGWTSKSFEASAQAERRSQMLLNSLKSAVVSTLYQRHPNASPELGSKWLSSTPKSGRKLKHDTVEKHEQDQKSVALEHSVRLNASPLPQYGEVWTSARGPGSSSAESKHWSEGRGVLEH